MHSPLDRRLIHLVSMAKSYVVPHSAPKIVLQGTTLAVPADRRLAVLGKKQQGKSVFLRLLAGAETPTEGDVIAFGRRSPVIKFGGLFHRRLSGLENIRFFARMMDLDENRLMMALDAYCNANGALARSLGDGDEGNREAAELALLSILPFDCYFLDEIGQLETAARERFLGAAAQRCAGIIFATNQPQLARRYADCAVVIRNRIVHPFSSVAEAIAFHER
jgi:capsular polysaccharide transport system ATP-binding protein